MNKSGKITMVLKPLLIKQDIGSIMKMFHYIMEFGPVYFISSGPKGQ